MNFFHTFFVFLLGLEFGSFANVCIYRLPRGGSVFHPRRSMCPWCEKKIAWYDNIPVLSFLFLKAKCRQCHSSISIRYPIVEFLMALLWTGAAFLFPWKNPSVEVPFFILIACFLFVLVVTTMTDLDWKIIPDEASYGLIVIGVALSFFNPLLGGDASSFQRWLQSLIGLLVGGGFLTLLAFFGRWVFGREAMGGGDIKLALGIGSVLGWQPTLFALGLASLIGGVLSVGGLLLGTLKRSQYIPFGPFINIGAFLTFLIHWKSPETIDLFLRL